MSSGQHKSTVILDGKADGIDRAAKKAAKGLAAAEKEAEQLAKRLRKAERVVDDFDKALARSEERLKKTQDLFGGGGGGGGPGLLGQLDSMVQVGRGAIDTLGAVGQAIGDFAEEGMRASAVFDALPFSISKAQAATGGLVSELDLATLAVNANRLKLTDSAVGFADFAGAAAKLGQSAGITAKEGIESLVAGLGRGSTEMLDNLGIVLKMSEAHGEYAQRLGKSVKELTDAEKAEAFRKIGMERVIEAAEGVTLKTDGASAAVARFNVELENLKNSALAGDMAQRSLEEGLAKLALTTRIQGQGVRDYMADELDLRDALRDVGVAADELKITQEALGDALDQARLVQKSRIKDLLLEGEVTQELVDKMKALLEVDFSLTKTERELFEQRIEAGEKELGRSDARRQTIEEELRFAEDQIAFLQGAQNDEALLNATLADQAELKAELLDLEGKTAEAAKVRRDAELAAIRLEGQKFTRKGGGRRRDIDFDLDAVFGNTERILGRLEDQEARALRALDRTGKGAQKRFQALTQELNRGREAMRELEEFLAGDILHRGTPDPFDLNAFRATTERARELEQARAEMQLEERLRAIEEQRAAGIEPMQLLEQETHARLALIDVQEKAANDVLAIEQLANQREAVLHDQRMARLEQERAEREKTARVIGQITQRSADLHLGAAQSVAAAVLIEGKSLKESIKNVAASEGAKQAILGASEVIRAAIAVASFNYPQAALHTANAAAAFAFAGAMAATYGIAGGFSGGNTPRGVGAAGFADGVGAGAAGGGGSSSPRSGSSTDTNPIPVSTDGGGPVAAGGPTTGGSQVVNLNFNAPVYGTTDKKFAAQLDRDLRDHGYQMRRSG